MVSLGKRNDLDGDANMGRETYLIPVVWEPTIIKWEQVSETKWEPVRYLFPVAAPLTGKVERITPLPYYDKPQYINNTFIDDFKDDKLNLEWTFIRVPHKRTYTLLGNPGYLRLFSNLNNIENRKRFSMMGFRQKESDFDYEVKMTFSPNDDKVESGVIHYQKEWNYLTSVVYKMNKKFYLEQKFKKKDKKVISLKKVLLKNYQGSIIFKIVSRKDSYTFNYSLDNGKNFNYFTSTDAIKVLDRNYTGALLGIFSTSNGKISRDYADFDWVRYKDFIR
tara:strand:- start:163 stop:996 length:834 start_codon:yes stop_codon:yes gene_type:complete